MNILAVDTAGKTVGVALLQDDHLLYECYLDAGMTWILMIYEGSVINLALVWNFADLVNALMAIPNLISLVLLSGVVVSETRKYLWDNRLNDYHEE